MAQADFDQARRDLQQRIGLTPSGSRTQPASRDAATNDSLPSHAEPDPEAAAAEPVAESQPKAAAAELDLGAITD